MKLFAPSLLPLTGAAIIASWFSPVQAHLSAADEPIIRVESKASLIHLGSLDSFDITSTGKQAARGVLDFLEKGDREAAERSIATYTKIIPDENFGGEYTALQWLLECELASEQDRREKFLEDPFVRSFHDYLALDHWKYFREFIRSKYHLDEVPGEKTDPELKRRSRFMEDFILFANPRRESWEKSSKLIAALDLKPGEKVADIGSGPGYFSFQFAKLVGPEGKVYAIDNNDDHLTYLVETIARLKVPNVTPVMPEMGGIGVPEKVDVVYMCSLYHNLYAIMGDEERNAMFDSIKSAMKPNARLVLVDNGPVEGTLPYHGPYITRDLIIDQFKYEGFDLVASHQFIPQRYMLVFKLRPDAKKPGEQWPPAPTLNIPAGGLVVTDLKKLPATPGVAELVEGDPGRIRVLSQRSLLRITIPGNTPTYSNAGREAAELFYNALKTKDAAGLKAAHEAYVVLIPKERTGDEYSALDWFCEYALTPDPERIKFITNPLIEDYVQFFAGDDFKRLTTYLKNKYVIAELKPKLQALAKLEDERLKKLGLINTAADVLQPASPRTLTATQNVNKGGAPRPVVKEGVVNGGPGKGDSGKDNGGKGNQAESPSPKVDASNSAKGENEDAPPPPYQLLPLDVELSTLIEWWEYLAFLNPRRQEWEKTNEMLAYLDVKPGQTVADVGSGAGYYTFKFADLVGKNGKVYALDMVREQLDNLTRAGLKAGFQNIDAVMSKENDCTLPENSLDMAYLCSLYHASYVTSIEYVKDGFVMSLKKALKPGGRLVIADNMPLSDKAGGYYGPRISKEMLIAQLTHYGFHFSSYAQFIPQRYMLVFTVDK